MMLVNPYMVASSAFSPLDIAGCQLWLNADSLAGADNSAVTTWDDSSASAYSFTQATSGQKPTLQTAELNGHQAVRFATTSSQELVSTANVTIPATITFFIVSKQVGTANLVAFGSDGAFFIHNGDGTIYPICAPAAPIDITVWACIAARANGSGSTSKLWLNGTLNNTSTSSLSAITGSLARIGAFNSGYYFDGDVAEIIMYDSSLSDGDVSSVNSYLTAKYAL